MSFECDICGKVLHEELTLKPILNQFIRGRNIMNVTFVVKYLMENKTSKAILNQFTRRRNPKSMALNQFGYFMFKMSRMRV